VDGALVVEDDAGEDLAVDHALVLGVVAEGAVHVGVVVDGDDGVALDGCGGGRGENDRGCLDPPQGCEVVADLVVDGLGGEVDVVVGNAGGGVDDEDLGDGLSHGRSSAVVHGRGPCPS
jgi:hypothetical protein